MVSSILISFSLHFRHPLPQDGHDRDADGLPAHAGRILVGAGPRIVDVAVGAVGPEPLRHHEDQRRRDLCAGSQPDGAVRSQRVPGTGLNPGLCFVLDNFQMRHFLGLKANKEYFTFESGVKVLIC